MWVPYAPKLREWPICTAGDLNHFMFGSRVGFSLAVDLMALFSVRKIQDGGRHHLRKISNGHISATGHPIRCHLG